MLLPAARCLAGRQPLPDPLACSWQAVGCCWETPEVLPVQLILAHVQLIMEQEATVASQQAQPLPVPLPVPLLSPCSLTKHLGEAGPGAYPTS